MSVGPDRKARIRAFRSLFVGVIFDLWREARLARRVGMRDARRRMSRAHRKRAVQFRETAQRMGGVVIKLGQFLSARADVMPEEYLQELSKLQDEVPPVPFDEIRAVIEEQFGRPLDKIYASFETEPLAAASLGQVHAATLGDGTEVAVKVQRPGIDELVDIDLATFAWLMDGAHRFTRIGAQFDVEGLVGEFARTLSEELDFMREGWHAERFCENFRQHPIIDVPQVFWEYTTDRVLTLQRIRGIKISDYEALEGAGIDRRVVADEVFQSYMQQILIDGFFHADPHPGNLFVVPHEEGPRITFIDFGMVGEITPEEKTLFKEGVVAGSRRDYDALIVALSRLGFIRPGSSLDPIKRAIAFVFDTYSGMGTQHAVSYEALESIQEDIRSLVYEHPFALPRQFGFLGRAAGTMIGLVSGLDPHYDFVAAVRPYVRKVTTDDYGFIFKQTREQLVRTAKALVDIPEKIDSLLELMQSGGFAVRGAGVAPARVGDGWSRVAGAFSMWAVGLLIAGVVLFVFNQVDLGVGFWVASILVMIVIALPTRSHRPRG